jgi:hypothetical protein
MQFFEEKLPVKIFHVAIDSRLRDKTKYLNPAEYVVDLNMSFKNVVYVELVSAIYDKFGTEQYVNLYIDELASNLVSNNNTLSGAFTQLPLTLPVNHYTSSMFKSVRLFEQPLSKLSRLTIRFLSHDGTLYPIKDHYLRFEVACCKYEASVESKKMEIVAKHVLMYIPYVKGKDDIYNDSKTPYDVLEVPQIYTIQGLIDSFKRKSELLRMRNASKEDFQLLKKSFKTLAAKLKQK